MKNQFFDRVNGEITARAGRSAWDKGVTAYALELAEILAEQIAGGWQDPREFSSWGRVRAALLNGAGDWYEYSYGGCSLIYDEDIARRLCCPSEFKRTRGGELNPNGTETWLDVQAHALRNAAARVNAAIRDTLAAGPWYYDPVSREIIAEKDLLRQIEDAGEYCARWHLDDMIDAGAVREIAGPGREAET